MRERQSIQERIFALERANDWHIEIARVMHDRARRRGCAPMVRGQSGLEDALGIAQATVGDDAGTAASLEPPDIEIAGRRGARVAARIYDEHVAGRAGFHRLTLDLSPPGRAGTVLVLA